MKLFSWIMLLVGTASVTYGGIENVLEETLVNQTQASNPTSFHQDLCEGEHEHSCPDDQHRSCHTNCHTCHFGHCAYTKTTCSDIESPEPVSVDIDLAHFHYAGISLSGPLKPPRA